MSDDTQTLEIYWARNNGHMADVLVGYIAVGTAADGRATSSRPRSTGSIGPTDSATSSAKYKLNVERMSPVHAVGLEKGQADADARAGRRVAEGRHRASPRALQGGGREGELPPWVSGAKQVLLTRSASPCASSRWCRLDGRREPRLRRRSGQSAPAAAPDLEGGWVRMDVDGSGSFNGLAAKFPRAVLTPAAQAASAEQAKRAAQPRFDFARDPSKPRAAGEGYVVTDGDCTLPGGVEPNSAAFHVVQSRDQVLIVRENPGLPRTIYMDGRAHLHLSRMDADGRGTFGTGDTRPERWSSRRSVSPRATSPRADGGRPRRSDRALPRVGRWPASHDHLHLAGPEGVLKPHTYEIVAERTPPGSWAFESWCDSSDPNQRLSIVPPHRSDGVA